MKKLHVLFIVLMIAGTIMPGCKKDEVAVSEREKFKTFSTEMRVLWSDHALWTRNVIINLVDGAPGTTEAVNRLLKNQVDIGDAFKPYYGVTAGNALTVLLQEHITVAADLIVAARDGNMSAYNTAAGAWYANSDAIAVFLNAANPIHFPLAHMKSMMKEHLDLTAVEVVARIEKNYPADVAAYDAVYAALMEMSDMLALGVALQHSDKF